MRNVKYIVKFVVNPMLDDEFDFKDEALAWAEEHLSEKPVVTAIDVEYPDEFGAEPIIYDSEEIFHYAAEEHPDEDKVDNAEKLSDLDNRLADLEAELDMPELTPEEEAEWEAQMEKEEEDRKWGEACMYDADEFDGHENLTESANVVSEIKKNSKFKDLRDATISKFIELYIDDTGAEKSEVKAEDVIEWVDDPLQVLFDFSDEFNGLAAVDIIMKDPKAIKICKQLCDENNVFDSIDDQEKEEPTDEEVVNYFVKEGTSVNDAIDLLSKEYKKLDEDVILFDPFGCDFSECEPMEVCSDNHRADCCKDFNVNAVDFLKELAVELGIADEVEISEISKSDDPEEDKNVYVNVDTENIDNDTQGKIADAVTDAIGEVVPEGTAIGTGVGDVNPPAEPAEPEPADEISEISDEAKDPEDVVPEEVKANEEPNVKVQVEDEKPAEEIAKCHVCPECGKEICECGNKELVEKNKVTHTNGDPAIGDAHFNGAFEGGEGCSENLEEEHHPEEPQPEVDLVKVGTDARKMAAAYGKPVIYGYEGPDHHGGKRYFEIDPIVCDDLNKCRDDVMKKYHPSGSILVAYPDQLDEANNCDKEDKMLFVEEQEEMSDIEFAEALKKGLEEKHNCK